MYRQLGSLTAQAQKEDVPEVLPFPNWWCQAELLKYCAATDKNTDNKTHGNPQSNTQAYTDQEGSLVQLTHRFLHDGMVCQLVG
mgnify:CR=1 FL=1